MLTWYGISGGIDFSILESYMCENILSMLQEVILSRKRDKWFWKLYVAHAYQDQFAGSL